MPKWDVMPVPQIQIYAFSMFSKKEFDVISLYVYHTGLRSAGLTAELDGL